jgi:hypothetical protein
MLSKKVKARIRANKSRRIYPHIRIEWLAPPPKSREDIIADIRSVVYDYWNWSAAEINRLNNNQQASRGQA